LPPAPTILEIYTNQYWELFDASSTFAGSTVSVSTLLSATSDYINAGGTVLIGANAINSSGRESLGGALADDFFASSEAITAADRIFTLARIGNSEVEVVIHNVITPQLDNANDYLQIDNIHLFDEVKVRLLDRWGVLVREWTNYQNVSNTVPADPSHDLSKVNTGNYICILEYKDGGVRRQLSQMITLINQ
jgi:CHU_C Type IX secretion signal domain